MRMVKTALRWLHLGDLPHRRNRVSGASGELAGLFCQQFIDDAPGLYRGAVGVDVYRGGRRICVDDTLLAL